MFEHATTASCLQEAAILLRDIHHNLCKAEALKITASDLKAFWYCGSILPEPIGGAHLIRLKQLKIFAVLLKLRGI